MQRKIYREHRKTLSVTIHGQIMDKLKETAAKKQMTISAVTDGMLYRGLVDAGLLEEGNTPGWLFEEPSLLPLPTQLPPPDQ